MKNNCVIVILYKNNSKEKYEMKKFVKKFAAAGLAATMMLGTVTAVAAPYVPLRTTAYDNGFAVEWDGNNQAVILTNEAGVTHTVSLAGSGGFNRDGRVHIPVSYAMELFGEGGHGLMALNIAYYMSRNLPYRASFSYREQESAQWIAQELLDMGFSADQVQIQGFHYDDVSWFDPFHYGWDVAEYWGQRENVTLRADRMSQNVILTIPGQSDSFIVVGAHNDSYPSPGISDNTAGIGLLMESAYRMKDADNYHTIKYVFFGAHELGNWGALYFYNSLTQQQQDNIVMMINADALVGGPYLIYSAATGVGPGFEALPFVVEAIAADVTEQIEGMVAQVGFEAALAMMELDGMGIESLEMLIQILVSQIAGEMPPVAVFAMWETLSTPATAQVDAIAANLNAQNNFDLMGIPYGVFCPVDHIVFLMDGHTVVYLAGLAHMPVAGDVMQFLAAHDPVNNIFGHFFHTADDNFDYIDALMPGMIQSNLRAFNLLLEEILLTQFN